MKNLNHTLSLLFIGLAIILNSCGKDIELPGISDAPFLYMPQAARGTPFNVLDVVSRSPNEQDTVYYRPYSAYLEGKDPATQNIEVEFFVDQLKLDSLNELEIAAGRTPYVLLPNEAYEPGKMTAVIKKDERISEIQQFGVNPAKLVEDVRYVLPMSIRGASPGTSINSALRTAFYTINLSVPDFVSGRYIASGQRNGGDYGTDPSKVQKNITKIAKNTYECNLIANLGPWCCSNQFVLKVNPADNKVAISGHLEEAGNLLSNTPGTTSTFDPQTNTFVLYYEYNYFGYTASMSETLRKL